MEPVRYYVPTRGRIGRQSTVKNLPLAVRSLITIVCPEDEVSAHKQEFPDVEVIAQPGHIKTIGQKREWIFKEYNKAEFAWQLDDDLKFKVCYGNHFVTPRDGEPSGVHYDMWFTGILCGEQRYRDEYSVLGLGTSYFAPKGGVKDNYHLGFAWGGNRKAIDALEMNRMDVFEDIDFTLQWLRKGFRIGVCYDVVVDQIAPDAPGGVTGERSQETIERDVERLIAYHPGLVSRKPLRPGAHPAAITRVSWAKAAKEGGLK